MNKIKRQSLLAMAAFGLAFGLAACGDDSSSSSEPEVEVSLTGAVFTSDYQTGELRWIDKEGKISEKSLEFYQNSKVIANKGMLYVLEGIGTDNISQVDPEKLESETKKAVNWQVSLDEGSNPADMAFDGSEAWVALQAADSLIKISTTDGKIVKSIKLKGFASKGESAPYVADIELDDGNLYVLMQRYSMDAATWATTYPKGLLAIYDASSGKLQDTIQLETQNPMNLLLADGELYVATHGEYTANGTDADDKRGIEKVDLDKKKSELYIAGEDMNGGISFATVEDGDVYAVIDQGYDPVTYAAITELKKINLSSKNVKKVKDVADASGSLAVKNGVLYIGDRTFGAEAIVVVEEDKATSTKMPKGALAPYSIALF
ncbi:hypothetical protein [Fibrobacter sp.]|uniref:hypothetical protein n=1 Tax=Fibrobacter sp. TaxID=35828 RepID=UPI00388EC8EC